MEKERFMKNVRNRSGWVVGVLSLLAWMGSPMALMAQEEAPLAMETARIGDPTLASGSVQDALKAQLEGLRSVALKGAVVAGDHDGVALLETRERGPVLVRAASQFSMTVAGLPLKIVVKDITPGGVEIVAPSLNETVRLASTLGPAIPRGEAVPGVLRHVEFRGLILAEALRMLAGQSGNNYSSSVEAGKVPVTVSLRNVPAQTAVEEICKTHNLWFRRDEHSGIVRVMTMAEFERDLVSFHEEKDEVFTLLYPNVLEVAAAIQDLYGDRVRLSLGRAADDESRDLQSRFNRFDLINDRSEGLGTMDGLNGTGGNRGGTTVISGDSGAVWTSNGGNGISADASGRGKFSDLTPGQAEQVQRVLTGDITSNGAERTVEALQDKPANIAVTVSRRNNMIVVRTSDSHAMEAIRVLIQRMDVPTPMVLLEVKILSLDLGDGFQSSFDYQFGGILSGGGTAAQTVGGFTSSEILPAAAGSMMPGGDGLQAGAMTFQVVNEYFRARMQLLETQGRVTTMATPMLLTANNEVSRLFLGEEHPLVRDITGQTIITTGDTIAVSPDTDFEYRPVGTTLLITPNINSDRTVTLRMLQENSTIKSGAASIPIVVSSGTVQNVSIDVVSSRSISGTFVAKDDMAVAIGGLIEETVSDKNEQVPLLGRIPVLGALFRRTNTTKSRRELIVMVRPHIISTPSEGEAISRDLLKELSIHPAAPEGKPSLGTFKGEKKKLENELDKPVFM